MLRGFDHWWLKLATKFSQKISNITGASSTKIARRFLTLSSILFGIWFFFGLALVHTVLTNLLILFVELTLVLRWRKFNSFLKWVEDLEANPHGEIHLPPMRLMRDMQFDRIFHMIFGILFLTGGLPGLIWFMYGFSMYVASTWHPPGKSLWARAKDKVKSWNLSRVRLPKLALPVPA